MPKLVLVKHSLPHIVPDVPAREWRLAEEGRRRCRPLAERLAHYRPTIITSSSEPKALETAQLVAAHLGVPYRVAEGLHEHDRENVGFLDRQEFDAAVAHFFAHPDELVLGRETAAQAQRRFATAVGSVLAQNGDGDSVVVAHGTVIALFVASRAGIAPFPVWRRLDLPSFVELSLPDYAVTAWTQPHDTRTVQGYFFPHKLRVS